MKLRRLAMAIGWLLVGGCEVNASCGGAGKTLDSKNAEALVQKTLTEQTGLTPKVSCPQRVKVEKGGRFTCDVTFDDVTGAAVLLQKDDQTLVEVESFSGFLFTDKLEAVIVERLQAQSGAKVEADCGPRVRPARAGDVFRCQARDDAGVSLEVAVTVKDGTGNVSIDVVQDSIRRAEPSPSELTPAPPAPPPN
jgi:hypothetical protein